MIDKKVAEAINSIMETQEAMLKLMREMAKRQEEKEGELDAAVESIASLKRDVDDLIARADYAEGH